jgi:diguanylate cyclase (GGDEF)-like protein
MLASSPSPSWHQLPASARFFVSAVCAAGAAVIGASLPVVLGPHRLLVVALALAAVPASMMKASFPQGVSTLTICLLLDYLTLLTIGPQAAVLVAAVGAWGQCTFRTRRRSPTHQMLFSISCLACATLAGGLVFSALGGRPGAWEPSTMIVPFAATATVFFIVNSWLVAIAIGLASCQSSIRIWNDKFLWGWPSYLLGAAVAGAACSSIIHGGVWLAAFLAIPLVLTVRNLHAYFERFHESLTDSLTGLPNQRFVLQHSRRELARAKRRGGSVAITLVDLDGFKVINDTHGHRAGDVALCHVARCLERSVRPYDVCARYGGDEFLIVLSDCTLEEAERRGEELRMMVSTERARLAGGVYASIALSVGTAVCPDDGESLEQLLEAADSRMYRNKPRSRGRVSPAQEALTLDPAVSS